ncbi:MAG: ornithine carbamoyltransferase [Omnitrophica WOR_2 bacterium GWF2_43_52]|nr:MAG: ornithine carbamoyltransferase [Omnitrophica WOR_2 bacterium GWA2_44_7]OGX21410.1 MAG: ornithine carbamoyltransferase [Omnitrophica WOR_2 bacterium GWF2_43_52]OGX57473.1 MAG: ornithine carbamoyltransferase [Omnitrophica WOR_2 bacterium RIFOXYC2_FULL_43_9]HAH21961.1 ornithine carbamoyltransferase [Candidatus Omnitrophota bacterium]HBG62638.1 ornithine carbamoyltransferase [Candidatus Omnitrophota bacterium]
MKKDLISIKDLSAEEIEGIFALTDELKKDKSKYAESLKGKTLALIFQKPSNRTRVSFAVGMFQLGGLGIYLAPDEINLGVRETIQDVARTLSRYVDGIVLRTFEHRNVEELAKYASIPVINGLSDLSHPCQGLADLYTIREKLGSFKGLTLAYVGDGNNVTHSLLYGCSRAGLNITIATPEKFEPDAGVVKQAKAFASLSGAKIQLCYKASEACKNADVIYTDVWTSMGREKEAAKRRKIFRSFQVNKKLLSLAKKHCLIMHCLPAHRGEEITDEAIDSQNSVVFDQAENRLHVQKAILIKLLKNT